MLINSCESVESTSLQHFDSIIINETMHQVYKGSSCNYCKYVATGLHRVALHPSRTRLMHLATKSENIQLQVWALCTYEQR